MNCMTKFLSCTCVYIHILYRRGLPTSSLHVRESSVHVGSSGVVTNVSMTRGNIMMCRNREPSLRYLGRCRQPINQFALLPATHKVKVQYMIVFNKLWDLQGSRTVKISILVSALAMEWIFSFSGGFFLFASFSYSFCLLMVNNGFPIGDTTTVTIPGEWVRRFGSWNACILGPL